MLIQSCLKMYWKIKFVVWETTTVLPVWFHKCNLFISKCSQILCNSSVFWLISQKSSDFAHSFMVNIHLGMFPLNVFCAIVQLHLLLLTLVLQQICGKSGWGMRLPVALLPPGVGLSALNIRLNSRGKHIFLWFYRKPDRWYPWVVTISIFSQISPLYSFVFLPDFVFSFLMS